MPDSLLSPIQELLRELTIKKIIAAAFAGFFCAMMSAIFALADASLLFSGSLTPHLSIAVGMTLLGCRISRW